MEDELCNHSVQRLIVTARYSNSFSEEMEECGIWKAFGYDTPFILRGYLHQSFSCTVNTAKNKIMPSKKRDRKKQHHSICGCSCICERMGLG